MSKLTKNGITTTTAPGQEQWEAFTSHLHRRPEKRIQYDYRTSNGILFSCVGKTLDACRTARDAWLKMKGLEG